MGQGMHHQRWAHRVLVASAGAAIVFGSLGFGHAAHAAVLPNTPSVATFGATRDTEMNAYSNAYMNRLVDARADSRTKALAVMDRRADAYAEELAAEAELQAALLNTKALAHGGFVAPLASSVRTSHFGDTSPLWESVHTGEDFAAPTGTVLVAIGEGEVAEVGDAGAYGLRTIIRLTDGTELWYCHQTTAIVKAGDHISTGQAIGAVGATGNTTGPHLHLEVRPGGGDPIDPVSWLAALGVIV